MLAVSPPHAPKSAVLILNPTNWGKEVKFNNSNGAIFCQVKIKRLFNQAKLETTNGTQKWKGKTPNFTNNPIKKRFSIPEVRPPKKRIEPAAWDQKYLTKESGLSAKNGKRHKWPNSIPAQRKNQWGVVNEKSLKKKTSIAKTTFLDGKKHKFK